MKKIALFVCGAIFFSAIVMAQQPTTPQQPFDPNNNPTVASITSKYTLKEINHEELTNEKVFPVLGNYQPEANSKVTGNLQVTLDPDNKGIIWVEGLPQGKIKALLRVSPSTYKIPAQKTEEGTDVAEGVLMYDKALNKLSICIGRPYDEQNPSSAFSMPEENMNAASEETTSEPQKVKTVTKGSKTKMKVKHEEKKVEPFVVFASKIVPETEVK